ncbi:MAG: reductase anchor subunit [Firmicutes bacterium]|nr:reductase anchor subunit [Bacillota bacterium]
MEEHLALTIFSVCLQAAIGMMVFVAIGRLLNKESVFKNAMLTASGLGIIGMLASLLHLGRPLRAINSLNQFGTSWLSREIWFTAIFLGLTIFTVGLVYVKPKATSVITGLSGVAAVVGLIDVYLMASIYNSASVPIWHNVSTYVEFYATAISIGAMLFLVFSLKEAAKMRKILAVTVGIVVIIQVASTMLFLISSGVNSSAALQSSLAILGGMKLATAIKWLFILAGAGSILWMAKDELSKSFKGAIFSGAALVLIGQIVGRYLFYAAMVVTGVGLS